MLYSAKEYTNLQLACGLAVEIFYKPGDDNPNTRALLMKHEEWIELRERGKSDDEIDQARLLVKQIAAWMKPIVCMAEDDIEMGLEMGVSQGKITSTQQSEMMAVLVRFAQSHPGNSAA